MLICENWVEKKAKTLKLPQNHIRTINMYTEEQTTHYLQPVINCNINRLWAEIIKTSEYDERLKQIEDFNKYNRWRKRGISCLPTKFGMSFTLKFMNQAGALVHVYTDGSVLVTIGGTEMGQGLFTKMIQIAAKAFNIPVNQVHISECATDKVPNSISTAASVQSDLNGMAVLNACNQIVERLVPFREKNPNASFTEIAKMAHFDRVNLSAQGFYKTPDVGYDYDKHTGQPFNYYSFGAACSEVEIDTLTGDFQILRTDIVMDLGESLNPAIDIGQIEGGFVQGVGWCTLEELVWVDSGPQRGVLFSRGPGTYKLPSFTDIPINFRISLLKDAPNPRAIHSSKGIGEPPLFLSSSVFFGIKEAITSARVDAGLGSGYFRLDSPATAERIRMACADQFTAQFTNNRK